ncbi:hypothetical protein KTF23_27600 [Burkholderia multivorans]|uniref:helix-turn-helix transcriptional regulator n=1 Tax=Burkholderia TaxID=32008 RepID=UPI0005AC1EB2|nr:MULTISPECIES: hypothetical protein [Burkholderia]KIP18593.1 prophage CP4-57 regulatory family protein [Burkholderia sp. MSHR3999]MBU9693602.1 hypothetical protein [Burkholderia multivorans]
MRLQQREKDVDFRVVFANFDACALISPAEFASLLGITTNAFYQRDMRGEFPPPVMRQNRYVRWRTADVRGWLNGLTVNHAVLTEQGMDTPRRGRRRKAIECAP